MKTFFVRSALTLVVALATLRSAANPAPGFGPYSYDGAGNIIGIGSDRFVYDELGRLRSATLVQSTTTHSQEFTYDRYGNILKIVTAGESPAVPAVNEATNRIDLPGPTTTMVGQYDHAGNLTSYNGGADRFSYDALNVMTESTVGTQRRLYLYTASNERIAVINMAGTTVARSTWTLRDASAKVLRRFERNAAGTWGWDEDYIYRGSQLLAAEVPGNTLHFHLDHLGTPRVITGNGGARIAAHTYYPFGRELTSGAQDGEAKKFTGHERDAVNLDYMHARSYLPWTGRFLSVDPHLDIKENLREPQRWNRYVYVTNNPLRYTDPDGRDRYQEPGFTKPYSERGEALQMDENTPTVVKASNYAAGGLTALGAAGFMGAGSALTAVGRGGMSLYRSVQVWNTLRTAAAGGVALSGSTNDMARQAMQMTVSLPGSPAQKAQLFQTLANQISRASQGTWSGVRMAGAGGEHVFAGRDRVLVITKDGRIFTGAANALKAATKDAVAVDYEKLKLLR